MIFYLRREFCKAIQMEPGFYIAGTLFSWELKNQELGAWGQLKCPSGSVSAL